MGGGWGLVEGHTGLFDTELVLCLNLTKSHSSFPKLNHIIVLFLWLHDSFLYGGGSDTADCLFGDEDEKQ